MEDGGTAFQLEDHWYREFEGVLTVEVRDRKKACGRITEQQERE